MTGERVFVHREFKIDFYHKIYIISLFLFLFFIYKFIDFYIIKKC